MRPENDLQPRSLARIKVGIVIVCGSENSDADMETVVKGEIIGVLLVIIQ